jgi:hypothetical protein
MDELGYAVISTLTDENNDAGASTTGQAPIPNLSTRGLVYIFYYQTVSQNFKLNKMLSYVNASHYLYKETIESGCPAQHDNYAFNPSACCGMHR